ncbi:MAG: hypothetical protein PWQ11_668 [Candidatus Diapherotrites archaeon]|nr:hypothetical protein [Candidatus Diapherotrites archaeon]
MRRRMHWSGFKVFVLSTFIVVAVVIYVYVLNLYLGRWKAYFMRSGNLMYYVYLTLFTFICVQIMKYLWKWQVRGLT